MKKPDAVLKELGQLYDFHRELSRFRLKQKREPNKAVAPDRQTATPVPRSEAPGG